MTEHLSKGSQGTFGSSNSLSKFLQDVCPQGRTGQGCNASYARLLPPQGSKSVGGGGCDAEDREKETGN